MEPIRFNPKSLYDELMEREKQERDANGIFQLVRERLFTRTAEALVSFKSKEDFLKEIYSLEEKHKNGAEAANVLLALLEESVISQRITIEIQKDFDELIEILKKRKEAAKLTLALLERKFPESFKISNDDEFNYCGKLFRDIWIQLNKELSFEAGQNQEASPLFESLIDRVVSMSNKNKINFIGLTQYQAEFAFIKWLHSQLSSISVGQEIELIVGKGINSPHGIGKLPESILNVCKSYGIQAEKGEGKILIRFQLSLKSDLHNFFKLEEEIQNSQLLDNNPRAINGFGHTLALWAQLRKRTKVLQELVNLTSVARFQKVARAALDNTFLTEFATMLQTKPKTLEELLLLQALEKKVIIYTFAPYESKLPLKDEYQEYLDWETTTKEELSNQTKNQFLRISELKETTRIGDIPFGERLRRRVEELEKIDIPTTSALLVLLIHLDPTSKLAGGFVGYNKKWSQFFLDDLEGRNNGGETDERKEVASDS